MNEGITTGLDLAKNVFQMHGVSDAGAVMISKRLSIWQHSASGVGSEDLSCRGDTWMLLDGGPSSPPWITNAHRRPKP